MWHQLYKEMGVSTLDLLGVGTKVKIIPQIKNPTEKGAFRQYQQLVHKLVLLYFPYNLNEVSCYSSHQ